MQFFVNFSFKFFKLLPIIWLHTYFFNSSMNGLDNSFCLLILVSIPFCRNKTGSVATQDIQLLNPATAGTKGTFTYNAYEEQGTKNHAFIFGGDDVSSSKEKLSNIDTFGVSLSEYPTLKLGTNLEDDLKVYLPPKTPTTFGTQVQVEEKM